MPIEKSQLFNRVCEALNVHRASEVSARLGISEQAIWRWKRAGGINLSTLFVLSDLTGVSIHWVLTGEGEMYVGTNRRQITSGPRKLLAPITMSEENVGRCSPIPIEAREDTGIELPLIGTISADDLQIIIHEEQVNMKVPTATATDADSILFQIVGNGLISEGLNDGDLLVARMSNGDDTENKFVIAIVPGNRVLVRRYHRDGLLAVFEPLTGSVPIIRFPAREVEVQYIVTTLTKQME